MLHRFAAASSVASIVIAIAAAVVLLGGFAVPGTWLPAAWCLVPLAWGVWAMLTPSRWLPGRMAIWGAILGLGGGVAAGPWLNLPLRIGGLSGVRWLPVIVGPVLYYLLWLLVAAAYRALQPSAPPSAGRSSSVGRAA